MVETLAFVICFLTLATLIAVIVLRPKQNSTEDTISPQIQSIASSIKGLESTLSKIEINLKDDFRINREENNTIAKQSRDELNETLKGFKKELSETLKNITEHNSASLGQINKTLDEKIDSLFKNITTNSSLLRETVDNSFQKFGEKFDKNIESFNNLQKEKFSELDVKQNKLIEKTETKLEEMRATVDEKLQKTLNERLAQSFETVGKQLQTVQEGLGEMKTLAQDVGGLKKVLSNVKMRGGIGEVQLAMLLEQVLAPDQYEANVKTKKGSSDIVEFAIKLPGKDDSRNQCWLPIDAKFPKDIYEQLQSAHEIGEPAQILLAQKNLEITIKKMAKDISEKYLNPPDTTDFGVMFLPFEGIYAEVVRSADLLEILHRDYKVIVTGPSTLAALLNSLQMGFKTLAIEKRSSEVWQVLASVKKEFENFEGVLTKAQDHIKKGLNQLDDVMGKRTRAIQNKLKGVEALNTPEATLLLNLPEQSTADEE